MKTQDDTKKHYKVEFTGRTVGSIGIFYPIEISTWSENPERLRQDLYKWYEHITQLKITEIQ